MQENRNGVFYYLAILFIQHLYHSKQLISFSSFIQALLQDNLAESVQMVKPFSSFEGCPNPGLKVAPSSKITPVLIPSFTYLATELRGKACDGFLFVFCGSVFLVLFVFFINMGCSK